MDIQTLKKIVIKKMSYNEIPNILVDSVTSIGEIGTSHYFSKMAALCEVTSDTTLFFQDGGFMSYTYRHKALFLLSSSLRPIS